MFHDGYLPYINISNVVQENLLLKALALAFIWLLLAQMLVKLYCPNHIISFVVSCSDDKRYNSISTCSSRHQKLSNWVWAIVDMLMMNQYDGWIRVLLWLCSYRYTCSTQCSVISVHDNGYFSTGSCWGWTERCTTNTHKSIMTRFVPDLCNICQMFDSPL